MSSQSKPEVRRKRRNKIVKIYANQDQIPKPTSRSLFPLFLLDELLTSLRSKVCFSRNAARPLMTVTQEFLPAYVESPMLVDLFLL